MSLFTAGLLTGAVGDLFLQSLNGLGYGNDGLRRYFAGLSVIQAASQAAALTAVWSGIYDVMAQTSATLPGFMAFSGAVDVLYRFQHKTLYPTLDDYYRMNTPFATIAYNVLSAYFVWQMRAYLREF